MKPFRGLKWKTEFEARLKRRIGKLTKSESYHKITSVAEFYTVLTGEESNRASG